MHRSPSPTQFKIELFHMAANARGGRSTLGPWLPSPIVVVLHLLCFLQAAYAGDYPTAGLKTSWTNNPMPPYAYEYADGSQVRPLLLRQSRTGIGPAYSCGFYCRSPCISFLFAIFIVQANASGDLILPQSGFPQVVWAANRARAVGENATLRLGFDGDLVLTDADGTKVWSANTSGKSVAGINLTEYGNLVLFGGDMNQIIWESFTYPTDSLVPGQKLRVGQSLKANDSATNWEEGLFYPTVRCPQWNTSGTEYFVPVDSRNSSFGCKEVTPVSCEHFSDTGNLLRLEGVSYFASHYPPSIDVLRMGEDEEECRRTCEMNCSCRAAFFWHENGTSNGSCYLTSEVLSLMIKRDEVLNYITFIKVKIPTSSTKPSKAAKVVIWGIMGGLCFSSLIVFICYSLIGSVRIVEKRDMTVEDEEEELTQVSGTMRRFSLQELRAATGGFRRKLGQGGFGSVYKGRIDGRPVAVKCLRGIGQGSKEFHAEVQTVGKIHHVNLVKLIGYCAEKRSRLLVYEFMSNGSLDRWIFSQRQAASLNWQTRCKIILGVAKGLSYLHEGCRQRIAHLDIKPQNILLDDRFEPKVSDFGLAKLIEREQTHVETRMRGTPGYMAPEWLSSKITEKVDVYSFGVVVLEIICGRRNLDRSRPEEDVLLVALLKRKEENGELLDVVDYSINDTDFHVEEALKMIKVAMWCLQDRSKRPSMSTVVKALEGPMDVESFFEDLFPPASVEQCECNIANGRTSDLFLPSVLSGPR